MSATKIEIGLLATVYLALASVTVYLVIDRLEVLPCKLTLADVPSGFEIVHNNGVYRARFKETKTLLTPYNGSDHSLCRAIERARGQYEFGQKDSDHSLCRAIERARGQYEFGQKDRQEQAREWEVVK